MVGYSEHAKNDSVCLVWGKVLSHTHTILIEGTKAIPELTATTATLLLIMIATFAVIASARIRKRTLDKTLPQT